MTPRAARGSGQQADTEPEVEPHTCHYLPYEAGYYLTPTLEAQLQTAVQQSTARRLSCDGKPLMEHIDSAVEKAEADLENTIPFGLHLGSFSNAPIYFGSSTMAFSPMRLFSEEGTALSNSIEQLPQLPSYEEALQWCAALKWGELLLLLAAMDVAV